MHTPNYSLFRNSCHFPSCLMVITELLTLLSWKKLEGILANYQMLMNVALIFWHKQWKQLTRWNAYNPPQWKQHHTLKIGHKNKTKGSWGCFRGTGITYKQHRCAHLNDKIPLITMGENAEFQSDPCPHVFSSHAKQVQHLWKSTSIITTPHSSEIDSYFIKIFPLLPPPQKNPTGFSGHVALQYNWPRIKQWWHYFPAKEQGGFANEFWFISS